MAARMRDLGSAGLALLNATDRQLVERYFGLGGARSVSLRELEPQTGLRRLDIQRRVRQSVAALLGPEELGRPCSVCGLLFVTPDAWSRRRTCGRG